jgi:hypothetical protein
MDAEINGKDELVINEINTLIGNGLFDSAEIMVLDILIN